MKAVRQVQYALLVLSTNSLRKKMIMSVPCTIKFYQIIFLLFPRQDGQEKYVTCFVSKLVGFFFFFFLPFFFVT